MLILTSLDKLYHALLSDETKKRGERIIIGIAIVSFLIHLAVIALANFGLLGLDTSSRLLSNPIAAIYTPFSFILIYEVYLLVYYLPRSISNYIGKQYEIVTLIIIRRIFKDLSTIDLTKPWFTTAENLQFTYDVIATIALFILIFLFYKLRSFAVQKEEEHFTPVLKRFIQIKKILAVLLVPVFLLVAVYSLGDWVYENFISLRQMVDGISNINSIFFHEFFTILILTDVLLLLFSFTLTDQFNKVIRNSGFVISTIMVKLSFDTYGLLNTALLVSAVLFGVVMIAIHNLYQKYGEEHKV